VVYFSVTSHSICFDNELKTMGELIGLEMSRWWSIGWNDLKNGACLCTCGSCYIYQHSLDLINAFFWNPTFTQKHLQIHTKA